MSPYRRPVADYMTSSVRSVTVDDALVDAERVLRDAGISCLPVLGRDGRAAGVISQTDLLQLGHVTARVTGGGTLLALQSACVGDVMTAKVVSVEAQASVAEAARTMVERGIHRLFILDDGKPVGVFSVRDAMRVVVEARPVDPLAKHMRSPVATVDASDPVSRAMHRLYEERVGSVIVLDDGAPAGIFTLVEALEARDLPPHTPVGEVVGYRMITLQTDTPLWRAAAFAVETQVRRVLVLDGRAIAGILSGLEFAKAATA